MDVQPDKQYIDKLFSNTTYFIDFYQRQYKWTDEPVKFLLDEEEELGQFMEQIKPERWKIFQALRVEGQNDESFDEVKITKEQFFYYLNNNKVKSLDYAVVEESEDMQGTYIMVDPAGRFFDNTKGYYTYSKPILEVGVELALNEITYDFDRFVERGGLYM